MVFCGFSFYICFILDLLLTEYTLLRYSKAQ